MVGAGAEIFGKLEPEPHKIDRLRNTDVFLTNTIFSYGHGLYRRGNYSTNTI
jgi:hypothetical protein